MLTLPTADKTARVLSGLLNRPVKAKPVASPSAPTMKFVSLFGCGDGQTGALCFADLPLAAHAGAALVMIPPDVAKESTRASDLDPMLAENFAEICNVLSRLFADDDSIRVKLEGTAFPPAALPEAVAKLYGAAKQKLDLEIAIDGYGTGKLSLRLA